MERSELHGGSTHEPTAVRSEFCLAHSAQRIAVPQKSSLRRVRSMEDDTGAPQREGLAVAQLVKELDKELNILLWGLYCNLVQLVPICLLCKCLVLISCATSAK